MFVLDRNQDQRERGLKALKSALGGDNDGGGGKGKTPKQRAHSAAPAITGGQPRGKKGQLGDGRGGNDNGPPTSDAAPSPTKSTKGKAKGKEVEVKR